MHEVVVGEGADCAAPRCAGVLAHGRDEDSVVECVRADCDGAEEGGWVRGEGCAGGWGGLGREVGGVRGGGVFGCRRRSHGRFD